MKKTNFAFCLLLASVCVFLIVMLQLPEINVWYGVGSEFLVIASVIGLVIVSRQEESVIKISTVIFYDLMLTLLVFVFCLIQMVFFDREMNILWIGIPTFAAFIEIVALAIMLRIERASMKREQKILI